MFLIFSMLLYSHAFFSFQGPVGKIGERGPIGPKGKQGEIGPIGDDGPQGFFGIPGQEGKIIKIQ